MRAWPTALVCCVLSACATAKTAGIMTPEDPCGGANATAFYAEESCERIRAQSTENALLDDYRKCVDQNVSDPTRCSAILQGLHAYSINVGSNQNQVPAK